MNIGDFAEQLLAQGNTTPKLPQSSAPEFNPTESFLPTSLEDQAPDISQVSVPDDFVSSLLEDRTSEEQPPQQEQVKPSAPIQESELHTLLSEVKVLLQEVKVQLVEATTCGTIGTNQGGATTKEVEDPMKRILRNARKRKKASR
tara:strand:- start:41917 stop:42351 length:435 start_codon:yes stop_codon:yes gene_type:complete